jgi:glyoxylase-like metal-dependent hydrolase (beta-lactamase superfamily II)
VSLVLGLFATVIGCASARQQMTLDGMRISTLREQYTNLHVVDTGAHRLLIDSGHAQSAAVVEAWLDDLAIDRAPLDAILLTHGHADHAGGAPYLRAEHRVPIIAGAADRDMLASGRNEALCPTDEDAEDRLAEDQAARFQPYAADTWIEETTDLHSSTGIRGRIVPLPGHTRGSLVAVIGSAAFVGDLFRGAVVGSSAEPHYFMCDLDDNKRDIRWLLDTFPDVTVFFTGHFGPVSRGALEAHAAGR